MRNTFSEYYHISNDKIKKLWAKGIFVLDTNVLLDFYRLPKETSDDLFSIIEKYSNRVWIPYQVALEFYRNRLEVVSSLQSSLRSLSDVLKRSEESVLNHLSQNLPKHPYVNSSFIKKELGRAFSRVQKEIDLWVGMCPSCQDEDAILKRISDLFNGKVGSDFAPEDLEKIFDEGKSRCVKRIPPGFIDVQNKRKGLKEDEIDNRMLFGDLIIWKQMIKYAADNKVSIIYITNDAKEDWWRIVDGKTIGPREELIKEFREETNQMIHFYNVNRFLKYAKDNEGVIIKENTLMDLMEVERYKNILEEFSKSAIGSTSVSPTVINEVFSKARLSQDLRNYILSSSVGKTSRKQLLNSYLSEDTTTMEGKEDSSEDKSEDK